MRGSKYVCIAIASFSLQAQVAEPILTKSAIPFGTGAGSVKLDYAAASVPKEAVLR
jgi:hypothetical protein